MENPGLEHTATEPTSPFDTMTPGRLPQTPPGFVEPAEGDPVATEEPGRYTLLAELARGGQSTVHVALDRQLGRQVAFKVLRPESDGSVPASAVSRFIREARITAQLDHPGIAPVHEVGRRADGSLYATQKLIRGQTLAESLAGRTTLKARLELMPAFVRIAEAVAYAHARGVVHRDLKPANAMVGPLGEAVVLDWGLARTGQGPAEPAPVDSLLDSQVARTRDGALIGTPAYMSPEQAGGLTEAIDLRSDVWSLGVMLYELLAGTRPFQGESLNEIINTVLTGAPVPLRTVAPDAPAELDAIVTRALQRAPDRRYPSAREMAADLSAWLTGGRVGAHEYTSFELIQKFVRRRRGVTAVAALSLVGLVGLATLWRVEADTALRNARDALSERDRANQEAEAARQLSSFLTGLFAVSNPGEARGNSVTARELLDRGAGKIGRELEGQPVVQAKLMRSMALAYDSLGLFAPAQDILDRSLETLSGAVGPEHPDVAATLAQLGTVAWHRGEFQRAREFMERGLALRERHFGPESTEVGASLHNLGTMLWSAGRYDEARLALERALSIREKASGGGSVDSASTLNSLGALAYSQGDIKQAAQIWERTRAVREKVLGPDHPHLAQTLNNLAICYASLGEPPRAVPLLERVVAIQEKVLGPAHPDLASALMNLGDALYGTDAPRAMRSYHRAVAIMEAASPDNPELGRMLDRRGAGRLANKDIKGARADFERSLALRKKALGEKDPYVGLGLASLGQCALEEGDLKGAESLFDRGLALMTRPDGGSFPHFEEMSRQALDGLATIMRRTGRAEQAAEVDARRDALGK